jgi:hypothetical protein
MERSAAMATEQRSAAERAGGAPAEAAGESGAPLAKDPATMVGGVQSPKIPWKRPPFVVRLLERYVFIYFFIVFLGLAMDALLRQQMNVQGQQFIGVLAWAGTALYAVALVVLLAAFSLRLRLRERHSWALWLLYLGLAALLVARGYFTASLLEPELLQGTWPLVMADVGLFGATAIFLGMIAGAIHVLRSAARRAQRRAQQVRLPRLRRQNLGPGSDAAKEGELAVGGDEMAEA